MLALETARKLRALTAMMVRTVTIPDTVLGGTQFKSLAECERSYVDTEVCYNWS